MKHTFSGNEIRAKEKERALTIPGQIEIILPSDCSLKGLFFYWSEILVNRIVLKLPELVKKKHRAPCYLQLVTVMDF